MKLFYQPSRCFSHLICAFTVLLLTGIDAYADDLSVSDWVYFEDDAQLQSPLEALQVFSREADSAEGEPTQRVHSYSPPFNVGNVDKYFWFHSRLQNDSDQSQV